MKDAARLIAVVIIIFFLPAMLLSLDTFRLTDREESFNIASGSSASNVTLSQDLYDNDTIFVSSVTSNLSSDAPIASDYDDSNNHLEITGLIAASPATHRVTVTYSIDNLESYYVAGVAVKPVPALLLLGILSIVVGAGVNTFRRNRED